MTDPDRFWGLNDDGTASHSSSEKKLQFATATQPIESESRIGRRAWRLTR